MALSPAQKAELTAMAKQEGVDPAALIAEAERQQSAPPGEPGAKGGPGKPPVGAPASKAATLPAYFLSFMTVKELRGTFLALSDPFPGDAEVASDWATEHPMPDCDDDDAPPAKDESPAKPAAKPEPKPPTEP